MKKNSYKPRPYTEKICKHCKNEYMSKDLRQVYCTSSCRVLACYERNGYEYHSGHSPKSKTAKHAQDIAKVAVGVLAADAAKHIGQKVFNYQSEELKTLLEIKNDIQNINQKSVNDSQKLQILENTVIALINRNNEIVNYLNEAQKNEKNKPTANILFSA